MFACERARDSLVFRRMRSAKFHGWRIAGAWAITAMTLVAGNFPPPAEGPVAFRRDRLPIDADTMATLSRQLVTLAQGLNPETAVNRRTAAQLLALATALNPGNGKAREVLTEFQHDRHLPTTDAAQLEKCREQVWRDLAWLETPEAGNQGQALAACLADVLALSDPENPKARTLAATGERGAWQGWIPDLAAYESAATTEAATSGEPVAENTANGSPAILCKEATVSTVLWKQVPKSDPPKWEMGPASLQMSAETHDNPDDGESSRFLISIDLSSEEGHYRRVTGALLALLKKQYGPLPSGGRVRISSPGLTTTSEPPGPQAISAAAAVLAGAAVSGIEPDATILGLVDETGAFKLSSGFWNQLQSLGPGNGGRLILPTAAAEFLPSMLALEKARFFFEYEVLLAANYPELVRLSSKKPDETLAKFIGTFREIRDKADLQAVGHYVANSFVRKRLVEIAQEAPFHFSAKMLAIQGAGNRPVVLPPPVLAAELRRAIEPMAWLVGADDMEFDSPNLGKVNTTGEICKAQLDRLTRYVDNDGRVLLGRVQDMVGGIRNLDRAARPRRDEYYDAESEWYTARSALRKAYQSVAADLAAAIGDRGAIPAR